MCLLQSIQQTRTSSTSRSRRSSLPSLPFSLRPIRRRRRGGRTLSQPLCQRSSSSRLNLSLFPTSSSIQPIDQTSRLLLLRRWESLRTHPSSSPSSSYSSSSTSPRSTRYRIHIYVHRITVVGCDRGRDNWSRWDRFRNVRFDQDV